MVRPERFETPDLPIRSHRPSMKNVSPALVRTVTVAVVRQVVSPRR